MTDTTRCAPADFGTRLDAHTIRYERDLPGHSLLDTLHARLDGHEPAPFMDAFRTIEETYRV